MGQRLMMYAAMQFKDHVTDTDNQVHPSATSVSSIDFEWRGSTHAQPRSIYYYYYYFL